MRTFLFTVVVIAVSACIQAQDIITKTDSSRVQVNILEINPDMVRYNIYNYPNGPIVNCRRQDIAYIIYRNGTVERITVPIAPTTSKATQGDTYNLDKRYTYYLSPEEKIKKCERLYTRKNYVGFNCLAFLNQAIGFSYIRDIKKASLILHVPMSFGFGRPIITNSMYSGNYVGSTQGTTEYDRMNYQAGISALFAPSMNREVNFLLGPAFTLTDLHAHTSMKYITSPDYQYPSTTSTYTNDFKIYRQHYGISIGLLARFTDRLNMNMLFTFGYKYDTYNESDPYGIDVINATATSPVKLADNVQPYVNYCWSIGYRF